MVLDFSEQVVPENAAIFIKNLTQNVNANPGSPSGAGFDMGEWTPLEGNTQIEADIPDGSYTIGSFYSAQTNELYFATWNASPGNNSVWLMDAQGVVTAVYQGMDLPFVLDPRYFFSEGRMTMELRSIINPVTGEEDNYKFLIMTNSIGDQLLIEVTSSIATQSFSTPSVNPGDRFFNPMESYYTQKEMILLGVPSPLTQIGIDPIGQDADSLILQNNMVREGYQFRVKFVDIFGRESEHGIISDNYISSVGGGCIQSSNGQPRCVNVTFGAGNALVQQIAIEFRKWEGDDRGGVIATNWKEYDTINKFIGFGVEWWNQTVDLSGDVFSYDYTTNRITYRFCGDKNSIDIPVEETIRTQPGIPRTSNGVGSLGKSILLSNNTYGFQPIDPVQMNKIVAGVTVPETTCPAPPSRTIQFYAAILDSGTGGLADVVKDTGDIYGFMSTVGGASVQKADQIFADQDNPGFIFYVAGQPQYNCVTQRGGLNTSTFEFTPTTIGTPIPSGTVPVQRATILAPAGKGIIRAASHKVKSTDSNIQNTSTYVCGIGVLNDVNTGLTSYASNPIKEIQLDWTTGNVLSNQLFIIMDMSRSRAASAGYLKEDVSVNSGQGVEMQPVWFEGSLAGTPVPNTAFGSFLTDHNGFYFAYSSISITDSLMVRMNLDVCDGAGPDKGITLTNNSFSPLYGYGNGTILPHSGTNTAGNYLNAVSFYVGTYTYPGTGRRSIIINNKTCDSALGAPGIPAVATYGGTDVSDNDGTIKIIGHNRYDYATVYSAYTLPYLATNVPDYSATNDQIIYSQKGGCTWSVCGDCTMYSRSNLVWTYVACTGFDDRNYLYPIDVLFNINGYNIKGVQSGGKYGIGWLLYDTIGRHTFVQTPSGDAAFVNVPNLNDVTTNHPVPTFGLSSLIYTIDPSFQVPDYFVAITPCVTENLLFSDFFSWAADWVQFVDNSGNNNTANPTFARIYYQSLNEYNKQNNFATNTGWDVITTIGTITSAAPVVGDVIQFIKNGVGDDTTGWFTAPLAAPISYDKNGAFITVEYDNAMASITNGALFRVIRPKQSTTNNIYYEQNYVIKLVNGQVADSGQLTGILPYYDSYMLNRSLPVPILKGQPGPIPPGQQAPNPIQYSSSGDTIITEYVTDNIANNNNVVQMSLVDAATTFPFFFESPSPSDFWGSHLANRGRIQTKNPYEAEYRLGTEFLLSAALGTRPNSFNGLSYYTSANSKIFDTNQYGSITAVIVETGTCLVICEADHFTTIYNQSTVYVTSEGTVNAQNTDGSLFTNPMKKVGKNYGCTSLYINSIRKCDKLVYWLDPKGRLVQSDYSNSIDVSERGGYYGWLLNLISKINEESSDVTFPVSGYDPKTNEYTLTKFIYFSDVGPSYINTQVISKVKDPITFKIDVVSGMSTGFSSYTSEFYGSFIGFDNQKTFLSFKQGSPWNHHHIADDGVPYNNFYGVQCPSIITGIVNSGTDIVKRYLWMEVYCKYTVPVEEGFSTPIFFADDGGITTERDQLSRLLIPQWTYSNGFAKAPFLCNLNTPADPNLPVQTGDNVIRDGDNLQGRWLQYSLRTQPDYAGDFFKLTSVVVFVNHVKKSGA